MVFPINDAGENGVEDEGEDGGKVLERMVVMGVSKRTNQPQPIQSLNKALPEPQQPISSNSNPYKPEFYYGRAGKLTETDGDMNR